ncbi:ABC transporter permease [Paeniglutamicibacter gangotriensis]|uniref:ABC transporter permease n=1 Tax=Paeniglutamicibacter gangotriensis TaxID=254787 RepID=A0A5B0E988_9MICC|nr:ABC transporter permease [Paeniglutamicibacter gangotriensis]KAA0974745.1 ABC transporter permease [Paeniglutamicibacter gangotriensis]
MLKFILKRLGASIGILFAASLLLYVLVINSGDPLWDLRESIADNRDYLMQQRSDYMNLDMPWYQRYWTWLVGVGGCFALKCDLGTNIQGIEVSGILASAATSTLRLVVFATVLAAVIGIAIGVLTAIRQYSGLDYGVTFLTFLFFSLPVFWAAVMLKEYMAIGYNDWMKEPSFSTTQIIIVALLFGFLMQVFLAGTMRRRIITFAVSAAFVGVVIPYLLWLNFFRYPQLGPAAIVVLSLAVALSATAMSVGVRNKQVLYPALITVGLGLGIYYATFSLMSEPNTWILIIGGILAVLIPGAIGHFMGGRHRRIAASVSAVTGLVFAGLTVVDHIFRAWPGFLSLKPRPIGTIGSETPNFGGDFWEIFLDRGAQLLLPTILLAVISLASYSRYTRASMLEVGQQDYIRTARSKGLSERTVIFRHAFRNALIPIATIAAFDFAGLIGGAVITESVFGWKGMGDMFITGLKGIDPAPVMAFFLITGTAAVLFNMLADIFYALLDPRIRV